MPSYYGNQNPWNGQPIVAISQPSTGYNIKTGDVFVIHVHRIHKEKMMLALQLHWAAVKILAMVGGFACYKLLRRFGRT